MLAAQCLSLCLVSFLQETDCFINDPNRPDREGYANFIRFPKWNSFRHFLSANFRWEKHPQSSYWCGCGRIGSAFWDSADFKDTADGIDFWLVG